MSVLGHGKGGEDGEVGDRKADSSGEAHDDGKPDGMGERRTHVEDAVESHADNVTDPRKPQLDSILLGSCDGRGGHDKERSHRHSEAEDVDSRPHRPCTPTGLIIHGQEV